jgi:hypothetical protein
MPPINPTRKRGRPRSPNGSGQLNTGPLPPGVLTKLENLQDAVQGHMEGLYRPTQGVMVAALIHGENRAGGDIMDDLIRAVREAYPELQ